MATVAAVRLDAVDPSLSAAGGVPASPPFVCAGPGSVATSGKGVVETPASSGGWDIPDAAALAAVSGTRGASGRGQGSLGPPPSIGNVYFTYGVLPKTYERIAYHASHITYNMYVSCRLLFVVLNEESSGD